MAVLEVPNIVQRAWKRTITPELYGAVGNGTTNDITALRAMFNAVQAYDRILFAPGKTYRFEDSGDHLYVNNRPASVTIWGYNSTLHATLDAQSGFQVENCADWHVYGLNKTSTWGRNPAVRGNSPHHHGITFTQCDDLLVKDVIIRGSYAGGLFIDGCDRVVIDHPTISNTSADGLHFTYGCTYCQVINPSIANVGDDGVAVVSYLVDPAPCSNIRVDGARVRGQYNGRGMSILGGDNIHYTNFEIFNSRAAGLYVGSESNGDFSTRALTNSSCIGGRMTACSQAASVQGHPAILLLNQHSNGTAVSNIEIGDIHVLDVANNRPPVRMEANTGSNITSCTIRDIYATGKYETSGTYIGGIIRKENAHITNPTTSNLTAGGKWVGA